MPAPKPVTILSIDQLEDRNSPALLNLYQAMVVISPPPPPPPTTASGPVVIAPLPTPPGSQTNSGSAYI